MLNHIIRLTVIICLTKHAYCNYKVYSEYDDKRDFQELMKILSKPRSVNRHGSYKYNTIQKQGNVQLTSWKNCGAATDPVQIQSLTIKPDPVDLKRNMTVSFKLSTSISITSPLTVELTLKKNIFIWIEIPCVDNVGSCTYNNLCTLLRTLPCPPPFVKAGIPCKCPVTKGKYVLPKTEIKFPKISLPSWLESGEYQVTAKLSIKGQPIGCVFIQLSLD